MTKEPRFTGMGSMGTGSMAGCRGFAGNRWSYVKTLSVVEVQETFFFPPRQATLQQWRSSTPESFTFCLRAWQLITHEPVGGSYPRLPKGFSKIPLADCGMFRQTEAVEKAYQQTLSAARTLQSTFVVFETPASFTPTRAHRERLASFFERVDREGLQFVWDPAGIWEESEVLSICHDLSLVPSFEDLSNPSPYIRLGKARYTDDDLLRLAELAESDDIIFIFNSINMFKDARRLQAMIIGERH